MKKLTPLILLIFYFVTQSFGQQRKIQINPSYDKKPFHLGISLGFNSLDYMVLPAPYLLFSNNSDSVYSVEPHSTVGLNLGIISDLRLGEYFNLRFQPGLLFGQRNLVYKLRDLTTERSVYEFYEYKMKLPSIYIDAPIGVKFRAKRINNYRPYLYAGMAMKYDLETKRVALGNDGYTIRQRPLDFFYEFGFGVDWYMVYFKLATEFKFSYGLKDILIQEPNEFSYSIEQLKSRMFAISFHFE